MQRRDICPGGTYSVLRGGKVREVVVLGASPLVPEWWNCRFVDSDQQTLVARSSFLSLGRKSPRPEGDNGTDYSMTTL